MAIEIMTQAWRVPLKLADKLLLIALADQANDEGYCWPSIATLQRKCGMSERTVQRVIARLVKGGHVSVNRKPPMSSDYRVHPKVPGGSDGPPATDPVSVTPRQADTVKTPRQRGGVRRQRAGGTPSARRGDPVTVTPNPSGIPQGTVKDPGSAASPAPAAAGSAAPEDAERARAQLRAMSR